MTPAARAATLAVVASYAFGVLLHVDRLPPWCAALALLAALWRIACDTRGLRPPGGLARTLLALVTVASVLVQFRTLNGVAAGTALLALMGALKLFELRARRDRLIAIAVSLFLLLAACLDRPSLTRVPLYVLGLVLTCTALALAATPRPGFGPLQALRLASRTLALSLPLAILLFVFFPRVAGSFWALPPSAEAVTGLGEEMSPGQIDDLAESDEPAFRVGFQGPLPPRNQRYWRGPVLHSFDGTTWRRLRGQYYRQQPIEYAGPAYRYRVSLEPHQRNWLFALERPVAPADSSVYFSFDYQLLSSQPVSQPIAYELTSYPDARIDGELAKLARRIDTYLPPGRNPRAQALALQLRERAGSDAAFAQAVLGMFRDGGFTYTLTPPKLDADGVDDFLFHTRRGFCGHYASAFVALMRAGGVPARVVTGYLGGEWNPLGGYLIVRQSDAHAWAETWIEGRGWIRIDPTAVVAPERLERGLFDFLPDAMNARERLAHGNAWVARLRFAWDAADSFWRDYVRDYDLRGQLALLERLGIATPGAPVLAAIIGAGLVLWLAWIGWQLRHALAGGPRDPAAIAYQRLCGKLARAGLARAAHEGPMDYAGRIARTRPELAAAVQGLCERYVRLRFGAGGGSSDERRAFARAVATFRASR